MTSLEQLINARKARIVDQLVQEVLDGWVKYRASLEDDDRVRVDTLEAGELVRALRTAYNKAESEKESKDKGGKPPGWKLDRSTIDAEREVAGAKADKVKADRRAAFLLGVNNFLAAGVGGAGYLYRNVGNPVTPAMIVAQGVYRGPQPMVGHVAVLTRIFQNNAADVIQGYVGSNEMFAPTGQRIYCMSMCTNPDDTLGRSPEWKFACPTPVLQVVQPATIQVELGVTLLQSTNLQGTAWSLRSDTGAIANAGTIALVCNGRADEHIFFTHIALGVGFAFRRYQGEAYQCQWKILNGVTVPAYTQHCATYEMDI